MYICNYNSGYLVLLPKFEGQKRNWGKGKVILIFDKCSVLISFNKDFNWAEAKWPKRDLEGLVMVFVCFSIAVTFIPPKTLHFHLKEVSAYEGPICRNKLCPAGSFSESISKFFMER